MIAIKWVETTKLDLHCTMPKYIMDHVTMRLPISRQYESRTLHRLSIEAQHTENKQHLSSLTWSDDFSRFYIRRIFAAI